MAILKTGMPASNWGFAATDQGSRLASAGFDANVGGYASNAGIFTVPSGHAGSYWCGITFMTNSPGSGTAHVAIRKNGTQISNFTKAYCHETLYDRGTAFGIFALAVGDTIDFLVTGPRQIHPDYGSCNVYMLY